MGHHIDDQGRFQSDKHADLPPDRIRLNIANPLSYRALVQLAIDYQHKDPELARDLVDRLTTVWTEPGYSMLAREHGIEPMMVHTNSRGIMSIETALTRRLAGVVYHVFGWLTTREKVSGPFSSRHSAGQAAELAGAYCEAQGWDGEPYMDDLRPGPR